MLMNSSKHTQVARRKLMNIQTCKKYAPEHNTNKSFSIGLHLNLVKKDLMTFVLQNIEQIHSPFFDSWR